MNNIVFQRKFQVSVRSRMNKWVDRLPFQSKLGTDYITILSLHNNKTMTPPEFRRDFTPMTLSDLFRGFPRFCKCETRGLGHLYNISFSL